MSFRRGCSAPRLVDRWPASRPVLDPRELGKLANELAQHNNTIMQTPGDYAYAAVLKLTVCQLRPVSTQDELQCDPS